MNLIKENYIRVTDVLFPFSGLKALDPTILKNAAERGTKVHEVCDSIINNFGFLSFDEQISGYIESFKIWNKDKEFIDKPERFFCDKYKITGECDGIIKNPTGFTLIDFKTPATESKSWLLQGSAYSYLAKQAGYNITEIHFVKLSKEGKAPKVFSYVEDFELFLKCLEVYNYFFKKPMDENPLDYI